MTVGADLNDEALLRYSRHILLDEWGVAGQQRLAKSHALIVGAGGLGCPAALFLASAGVGMITIADHDRVDLTNLQRQIAHETASVGELKVDSLKRRLNAINPLIDVATIAEKLEAHALRRAIDAAEGRPRPMISIERFDFYDRAKTAYAVIQTGERRFYGCFMFRKGVIAPDADQ